PPPPPRDRGSRLARRDRDVAGVDRVGGRPVELAPPDRVRRRALPPLAARRRARNVLPGRPAVLVDGDPPRPPLPPRSNVSSARRLSGTGSVPDRNARAPDHAGA